MSRVERVGAVLLAAGDLAVGLGLAVAVGAGIGLAAAGLVAAIVGFFLVQG